MRYVFPFGHDHGRPPMQLKALLGGKGANLAEMSAVLDLPVPPGFTITTEACRAYRDGGWPDGLSDQVAQHLTQLEERMRRRLGDSDDPLLVSVRSGAKFSMPGMMDTVLNLGLNDASTTGLAGVTGDVAFAYDSYRRFIEMYGRIVLGVTGDQLDQADSPNEHPPSEGELEALCERLKSVVGEASGQTFPQDPQVQLRQAIEAVFRSWDSPRAIAYRDREGIPDDLGTAVTVQTMVFGNRDDQSGTGVAFTRNAATGEDRSYGDFLLKAQGEDVVAGISNTENLDALSDRFPEIGQQLLEIFERLEAHYRDMCDTEFTIEQGHLWMLQTRIGKRTGRAALKMAVDMVGQADRPGEQRDWSITREEALTRVAADHLDQVLHPRFASNDVDALARGLGASPGAAVGRVYFSADDAVAASERGEKVILVRNETSPEDIHGMQVSEGILTARGGLVSHAAVVARGWGIPAVVGAEALRVEADAFTTDGVTVHQGEVISLDGTSGAVVQGEVELAAADAPDELAIVLGWADDVRHGGNAGGRRLGVRANADTGPDAARAREFGAEGIGLCRTEHMFLDEERLSVVQEMILADDPDQEREALARLGEVQRGDFLDVLEAMDGLPVTVRLLDPPLHEFLPRVDELRVKAAGEGLSDREESLLAAAESWSEVNPMLGTRGVRLGVLKPGLYAMQVRALMEAVADRLAAGGTPLVEVMIPLVVSGAELALARSWVEGEVAAVAKERDLELAAEVGTMIETPRAALCAEAVAEHADFFSFGTNDLTQMTYGFSRDDIGARLIPAYLEEGLLPSNPFETVDPSAVGELVALGVERGRRSKASLTTGVCGEHGGDPASIRVFLDADVDYVSCSPFRVPVARLAAAQAIIGSQT